VRMIVVNCGGPEAGSKTYEHRKKRRDLNDRERIGDAMKLQTSGSARRGPNVKRQDSADLPSGVG